MFKNLDLFKNYKIQKLNIYLFVPLNTYFLILYS